MKSWPMALPWVSLQTGYLQNSRILTCQYRSMTGQTHPRRLTYLTALWSQITRRKLEGHTTVQNVVHGL
jgi:hypothetical protein